MIATQASVLTLTLTLTLGGGGGGFSMPEVAGERGPLLDYFLLSLTGASRPRCPSWARRAATTVETPLAVSPLG